MHKKFYLKFGLIISMLIFFSFGFFHLTKFETVDEHFWKDQRIKKYWTGVKLGFTDGKWKKTRINDKPGITVALISGIGLLSEPNPEANRIRDNIITENRLYTVYNSNRTEKINFAFRLPLLIFNTLWLMIILWLLLKIIPPPSAILTVILIATSPILIGISQVINPDTLLWSFSFTAILAYFALLANKQKKFLALTILFTGLALLSKYTGNILFIFFIIIFLSKSILDYQKLNKTTKKFSTYLKTRILEWLFILGGSILVYGILMPASLEKTKHLWNGTIYSPAFAPIFWPLIAFLALLFLDTIFLKNLVWKKVASFFHAKQQIIFRMTAFIPAFFFLIILINPFLPQPFIPLENVKEDAFVDKELLFPMLDGYSLPVKNIAKFAIEIQPFLFSLYPIIIILLLALWIKIIWKGLHQHKLLIFFLTLIIPLYFGMLLTAGVLANPRYSILLYPTTFLLASLALTELFPKKILKKATLIISGVVIFCGIINLWNIKPFYLNYENFLLPKEFILTDAWGYGGYEAAQYLNSLPNPEQITIWADRSAICQFIKGKCIRDYKIDLSKTIPDYLVYTRRGSIRHKFEWRRYDIAPHDNLYYYTDNVKPIWEIHIGDRPDNFVKIIPFSMDK